MGVFSGFYRPEWLQRGDPMKMNVESFIVFPIMKMIRAQSVEHKIYEKVDEKMWLFAYF